MATFRASRVRLIAGATGVVGVGGLAALFVLTATTGAELERATRVAAIVVAAPVVVLAVAWWRRSVALLGLATTLLAATWVVPRLDEELSLSHALAGAGIYIAVELVGYAIDSRAPSTVEPAAALRRSGFVLAVAAAAVGLSVAVAALTGGALPGPGWLLVGLFAAVAGIPALVWLRPSR